MNYLGDYAEDQTVRIYFTTHDKDGGVVAPSSAFEVEDVRIYKDGSATQKATTNGLTMTSPFDSVVGLHLLAIDTSNDTGDGGFWAAGSEYSVILTPDETIDTESVIKVIATFSIERAGGALALLKNATYGLSALETLVDDLETRLGTPSDLGSGATVAANLVDIEGQTDDIGAAGAGLTAIPWNGAWDAEVESEVTDALAAINLDHLLKTPVSDQSQLGSGGGNEVVDGTILGAVLTTSGDPDNFNLATDSLEAIRNKETDIETEIGAAGAGLTEAGGTGDQLTAIPPPTVEGPIDLVEAVKVILAFVGGKSDGGGTATIHFRDQADSLNRITMTVDADGNRSAVTLNVG